MNFASRVEVRLANLKLLPSDQLTRSAHLTNYMVRLPTQFTAAASRRTLSCRRTLATLSYGAFGNPLDVLTSVETHGGSECAVREGAVREGAVHEGAVRVKWLYSPINPADKNMIEGTYPLKPSSFPATPGSEGVGVVSASSRSELPSGSLVFPKFPSLGLWTLF